MIDPLCWQLILVYINAFFGLVAFEWSYAHTRRMRKTNDTIDKVNAYYPHYMRSDAHKWARWKFWPTAMTLLFPRFLLAVSFGLMLWLIVLILLCGADMEVPLAGKRKSCLKFWYKLFTRMQGLFCWFTWFSYKLEKNVDYSEWLGKEEGGPFDAEPK
jgi:hypothetical protein